jgi:DNA-directed RNA polymerase subunit RPC12/RpoP
MDFEEYLQYEIDNAKRIQKQISESTRHVYLCSYCGKEFGRQQTWIIHMHDCPNRKKKEKK